MQTSASDCAWQTQKKKVIISELFINHVVLLFLITERRLI